MLSSGEFGLHISVQYNDLATFSALPLMDGYSLFNCSEIYLKRSPRYDSLVSSSTTSNPYLTHSSIEISSGTAYHLKNKPILFLLIKIVELKVY